MIFVTVGMHDSGFDRLVRAADAYAADHDEETVIQRGVGAYQPHHAESFDFVDAAKIDRLMREARVVVTHAGAGSLLQALAVADCVVAVPRLRRFGEHVDDHQLELAEALDRAGRVRSLTNMEAFDVAVSTSWEPQPQVGGNDVPLVMPLREIVHQLAKRRTP